MKRRLDHYTLKMKSESQKLQNGGPRKVGELGCIADKGTGGGGGLVFVGWSGLV